ncbi:MAG: Zn-dependent protease [Clostridiaceae bacterium]|nr:Zn-dependent protease [Clostridiaceae bacterium]
MQDWFYYVLALLTHEFFHYAAAKLFFKQGMTIGLTAGGFRAEWKGSLPEKSRQCFIYASGPIGNFAAALVIFVMPIGAAVKNKLIYSNIFIGLFNLIPIYPMDGGNILLIILYDFIGSERTYSIMKRIGIRVRLVLIAAGLVLCIAANNPSLLVAIAFMPGAKSMKRTVKSLNLNALIHRRERILKRRAYPVRHILVLKEVLLGEVLSLLEYDQFHIIHIADETMKLICEITEQQLIDAMVKENAAKTLEEVFLKPTDVS